MKLLHLPLNVPGSEQVGQERGFKHVFKEYAQVDYLRAAGENGILAANDVLIEYVKSFRPDIIWAQLQETDIITPETWQTIRRDNPKLWLTTWSGDARDYLPTNLSQVLPLFDIYYNCTDQKELYQPVCKRYEFMPIAIDPEEATDYSHEVGNVPEIIFIGNNYGTTFSNGPFRAELMHALSVAFGDRFGVYGTGWNQGEVNALGPTVLKQQSSYYHKTKCIISVDHIQGILHWSERLPWALASGAPVVMQHQRGIDKWFKPEEEVLYFGDITDCIMQVNRVLANDFEPSMTEQAQNKILNHHTWQQRAEQIKKDYEKRTI